MIKEVFATGTTIDEAIAQAKAQLGAPEDADVSIEVLEMPQKKTFGLFGGSKARVRAYYDDLKREETEKAKINAAPPPQDKKPVMNVESNKGNHQKPEPSEKGVARESAAQTPAGEKPEEKPLTDVNEGEIASIINYLRTILNALELNGAIISAKTSGEELVLDIECGDDYGIIIGRRGETLDAVQYLVRLFANREKYPYSRIAINVGNYREKRENNLKALAARTASQVVRYGRQITLDPMNPYERRIIHTTVQEIKGATSYSVGSESDRRVVIALQEGYSPYRGKGGGKGGPRGGYGGNNHGKGAPGYNNNGNSRPPTNNTREQRPAAKDAESVSLYGKIEPKK